jgi:cyclic-di-GMP-binding biofilm dispersal mediator protein
MSELQGASLLIVGATGGLGRVLASELVAKGAVVTLASRTEAGLFSLGIPGAMVAGDVTKPGVPESFVSAALEAHQRLDGVIYAAGAVAFGSVAELSDEVADQLWEVNTRGWMSVLRAAMPALVASGTEGRAPWVLTLSGVVAEAPTAGIAAYSAVKAALHAYGVAAGRELRRGGIRLIDARPGHTETDLSKHPLAGQAPAFPAGLSPQSVATRIIEAIVNDERDLPSTAFHGLS